MVALALALAAAALAVAAAQWPLQCEAKGTPWSQTRCPAAATCCKSGFSTTGFGCCPGANATCCGDYQCCPAGTKCVAASGSGYDAVYNCTGADGAVGRNLAVCKPGPTLPWSNATKNVLVIGDSLSIGFTPVLAKALEGVALVQHAPADTSDGGAEEAAYGVQCIDGELAGEES